MKNQENNNCNWEGRKITQTKRSQIKLTPLEVEKNGSACHKQYKNNYEGCGSIVLRDDEVYANLYSALLDRSKGLVISDAVIHIFSFCVTFYELYIIAVHSFIWTNMYMYICISAKSVSREIHFFYFIG